MGARFYSDDALNKFKFLAWGHVLASNEFEADSIIQSQLKCIASASICFCNRPMTGDTGCEHPSVREDTYTIPELIVIQYTI